MYGHLARIPPGRLPLEVLWAHPTGWRPSGRPGTRREGLHVPSGLGTPQNPTGGAGKCRWGEGYQGFPPGPVNSANQSRTLKTLRHQIDETTKLYYRFVFIWDTVNLEKL